MKSIEFSDFLRDVETLLQVDGNASVAASLDAIRTVLETAGPKQVRAAMNSLAEIVYPEAVHHQPNLGSSLDLLERLLAFTTAHCKKAIADDVRRLLHFCERHSAADVSKFVAVTQEAFAAKPKKTASAPAATDAAIELYLQRLDKTLGFEPAFDRVFEELKADKTMRAPQLKKLAKSFTQLSAKSAPDALKSMYRRHANLLETDKHKAAVGGRVG